jgi:hypothetical protein
MPAGGATAGPFPLNALDHAMAEGLAEVVYFYRHTLDPVRLEQSLRRTLQQFSMLCGRLRQKPDGALSIGYSRSGACFTVSESNLTLETAQRGLLEAYPVYDFIEQINPLLLTFNNRPLATVRLTRMASGGSALGISWAHVVADGYSFYYFINCWSQVHEGLTAATPWHDRSALSFDAAAAPFFQSDLPAACNGFRLLSAGEMFKLISRLIMQRRSIICRVLSFSRLQLAAIKNAAGRQGPVSLNDALSAHLWQCCTKIQDAPNTAALRKLLFGAGMRSRIDHPLAGHYFGNAISNVVVTCSVEELRDSHISVIADKCRRKVAALDLEYLQKQMLWLQAQEKRKRMRRVFADVNPFAGDCAISSLFKLPVYGACFDGHKPCWAGVPAVPIPWVMYLLPAPAESGGIDVYANLPRSAADKLRCYEWQAELYKYGEAADAGEQ